VRAYRLTIAVLGAFLTVVTASLSAGILAFVLFPILVILGGNVLWLGASRRFAAPVFGILGASALAGATAFYVSNHGNWNQPGMLWMVFVASGGVTLLGVNVFAIYVRHLTSNRITLFGGPILLVSSAAACWWLLSGEASRADVYVLRAVAFFVGIYLFVGLLFVVNRGGIRGGSSQPT
jgi:hypothetical protein